ncbi:Protein SEB-2 b [Aphelenchoides avenae]|nr:Protein SEB-2 b [Aphelenchus avenae]
MSGSHLPIPLFRSLACANCILYIYLNWPPYNELYETQFCPSGGLLVCDRHAGEECTCENSPERTFNLPEFALNSSTVRPIGDMKFQPTLPDDFVAVIRSCCEAASDCCNDVLVNDSWALQRHNLRHSSSQLLHNTTSAECPATWDGWQCFKRSHPGTVRAKCPTYIFGDFATWRHVDISGQGDQMVTKDCMESGNWRQVTHNGIATEWTNYTGCNTISGNPMKFSVAVGSFLVTVIALIPALCVVSLHRHLKKQSVLVIHRHLMLSFFFQGLFFIFNTLFFVASENGISLYYKNHIFCRLMFAMQLRYFRTATFMWMLAEGVYLFRLLMCSYMPRADDLRPLRPYFVVCWGVPLVITVIDSAARLIYDNQECWMRWPKPAGIEWIHMGPCLAALFINLVLMLIIVFALVKKLRHNPHLEPADYSKAVRAVFMLVPVFGIHFVITLFRMEGSYVHQLFNLALDGLQGLAVSIIVFYTNRTCTNALKAWIRRKSEMRSIKYVLFEFS